MIILCIALLGALTATNEPSINASFVSRTNDISAPAMARDSDAAVEKEFQKLMDDDDNAQAEVDRWIQDNAAFAAKGAGVPNAELNGRIRARLDSVSKTYEDFLKRHPDHARAHTAYGSFLGDIGDEEAAKTEYEKALKLDPKDPAPWNNLANVYGEEGPVTNAFIFYAKAIELNPKEPVYHQNLATAVYLYRKDAREFYGITEQQVFDKALALYTTALKLDPANFPLAMDLAQTYYGIKPTRTEAALNALTNALAIAHDDIEREGVYLHIARFKLIAGRFDEARKEINSVTNEMYTALKQQMLRNLNNREMEARGTNSQPSTNSSLRTINPPSTNAPPEILENE